MFRRYGEVTTYAAAFEARAGTAMRLMCVTACRYRRCFSVATGEAFAVKYVDPWHDVRYPYLAENEVDGLVMANGMGVPRVVNFIELFSLPSGIFFILE